MQFLVAIPLVLISLTSISTADPVVDCRSSGPKVNSTTLSQAVASIGSFCDKDNGLKFWNLTFVSPVSMGQNHPDRLSAVDLNTPFSNDLGPNNLWLRVSFKEGSCVGSFPFTYGPNDAAKKQTCIDNFMPILNQCDTNNPDKKFGGKSTDVCKVYEMAVNQTNPLIGTGDTGNFGCQDTNTSYIGGSKSPLFGTCTCAFTNLPNNTAVYDRPSNGTCTALTHMPGDTHVPVLHSSAMS